MKSKIILLAAVAALSASCSEDFLTSEPILAQSPEVYYQTDDQMYSALVAAYDPLTYHAGEPLGYFLPYAEIASDNGFVGLGADTEKVYLEDCENYTVSAINDIAYYQYYYYYMGITRCNIVLEQEYTSDVTEVYKSECYFLRAWYNFQLLRTFGPCYISLDSTYALEEPFVRNTREEMNAQIESDLLLAIEGCADVAPDTGRINKSAARALLAKHYLYKADWDNDNASTFADAIPLFESVISSGQYELCPYTELFNYEFRNNKECVFEIQTTTIASGTHSQTIPWNTDAGFWAKWAGIRTLKNHPDFWGEYMWGGLFLSHDLYTYYIDGDETRRDETFITEAQLLLDGDGENASSGTMGYDGTAVLWPTGNVNPIDWEGYDQRKFTVYRDTPYTGTVAQNLYFGNVAVIRYADVYLMLAEAYLRGNNNEAKAKELINTVRAIHEPNAKYPTVDDMMAAFPDRFPTVLDVLWYERRVELAGEGDRRFDLVRTGRCEDVMVEFLANGRLYGQTNINWNNTMNYLPIAYDETNACPTLTTYPDEAYE